MPVLWSYLQRPAMLNFVVLFNRIEESEVILLYEHLFQQCNDIRELIETYCELQNERIFLSEAWHVTYWARIKFT